MQDDATAVIAARIAKQYRAARREHGQDAADAGLSMMLRHLAEETGAHIGAYDMEDG